MPLIRFGKSRRRMAAFYEDHLICGVRRRGVEISEEACHADGEELLKAGWKRVVRVNCADVSSVELQESKIILRRNKGRRVKLWIAADQLGGVQRWLAEKCGGKCQVYKSRALGLPVLIGISVFGSLLLIMGVFLLLDIVGMMHRGDPDAMPGFADWVLFAGVTVPPLAFFMWLFIFRKRAVLGSLEQWLVESDKPKPPRPARTRRAIPPRHSVIFGWIFKIVGVVYILALWGPLDGWVDRMLDLIFSASMTLPRQMTYALIKMPGLALIFAGYRLSLRRYEPEKEGGGERMIVFLRPFDNDLTTTFQPKGVFAELCGLRASGFWGGGMTAGERATPTEALMAAHPVRLVRMVAGIGNASSEESFARYFQQEGRMIAIGRPGEHLASPGAERMYVADGDWQANVLRELQRAHIVVMQPGVTEGVRWELGQVRTHVEPTRVLLCLVAYRNNPEAYEKLCGMVKEEMGLSLPRCVPFLEHTVFVYFDVNWNVRIQPLSHHSPILWSVLGNAANLKHSLGSFMKGIGTESAHEPAPVRYQGRWERGVHMFLGVLVALAVLIVPIGGLHVLAGRLFSSPVAGHSQAMENPSGVEVARGVENAAVRQVHGQAVGYTVEIPSNLRVEEAYSLPMEYEGTTVDHAFSLKIIAASDEEDLKQFGQMRASAWEHQGVGKVKLESETTVTQENVMWHEAVISITLADGIVAQETARATSSAKGTVLMMVQVRRAGETDEIYERVRERIFGSFRFSR